MEKHYDVIVAGGGPGGVMAAIASARLGNRTLLIERHGFLGGMNTAALVGPVMTFHAGTLQIVRGIPGEIFEKLKVLNGTPGHLVDPIWANTSMTPVETEVYKPLLITECLKAGVELLLHSWVVNGKKTGSRIDSVVVAGKAGLEEYSAKVFIDATGDGDLSARMGCAFQMGRAQDGLTQPMTLMFKMAGVDLGLVREAVRDRPDNFYLGFPLEKFLSLPGLGISGFFDEVKRAKAQGAFPFDRDRVLFFGLPRPDQVSVNTLRIARVDGTRSSELTRAETWLRAQVPVLEQFMKEWIPGFKNSYVFETATQVGVRETRHIEGEYKLTGQDILEQKAFGDVIAHASYPIDIHSPDGSGMKIVDPRKDRPESYYDIPFRTLLPLGLDNLIVTGRCISAEHEASASARISATCMALGQAAGTAAALHIRGGAPRMKDLNVAALQAQLINDSAFLVRRD